MHWLKRATSATAGSTSSTALFTSQGGPDASTARQAASTTASNMSTTFQDSLYQQSAKQLNELVNEMRDAGAHFELDLPTVVVCGNQSAGKSSLLEALSAITFPRNRSTCTRCPSEVRLALGGHTSVCCRLSGVLSTHCWPAPRTNSIQQIARYGHV
jgi:hypothetical protein